jgi:alpha-methylacyl-CoA racemase
MMASYSPGKKESPMHPLEGIKVLDLSSLLPGPFATLYLADWGADVTHIHAEGREDLSQSMPPFANGTSTTYGFLGRSKKNLVLDLKKDEGRQKILELLEDTDILVEQYRPGVMAKFGLDYKTLASQFPRLIYCSITGYGQTGPQKDRAGHDINYAARSGIAVMTGTKALGPVIPGVPLCDLSGSLNAVIGILTALYRREKNGQGQYIDISLASSGLFMSALWAQMELGAQISPQWESTPLNGASLYGFYKTRDQRYLSVGALEPKFVKGFLEAIGGLKWLALQPDAQTLKQMVQDRIAQENLDHWVSIFKTLDVCVEPVQEFSEILRNPNHEAFESIVDLPIKRDSVTSGGMTQKQLANPIKFMALDEKNSFRARYAHMGQPLKPHG